MNEYVLPPPPQAAIPVRGGGLFAVRRIFCVGRNYAEHAREMGADPEREAPFFFAKPADAVQVGDADMAYPPATAELHFEMELVAAIGAGGADIAAADALGHVWGYAAGLDMTRRDMQAAAKKAGRPWDMAKGFDGSAPVGLLVPASECGHPRAGRIELRVDGAVRQAGDLGEMIWDVAETVAALSALVRLAAGDLVFMGTPAGVGAVARGAVLVGTIEGVGEVRTTVR